MSRKGDCCDNACSEPLFGSLKVERLHGMELKDHREAKDATLDWLLWYNGSALVQRIEDALDSELPQPDTIRAASPRPNSSPRSLKRRSNRNRTKVSNQNAYERRILRARSFFDPIRKGEYEHFEGVQPTLWVQDRLFG